MTTIPVNFRENIRWKEKVVKWVNLKPTVEALRNNFDAWEKRNAERINKFVEEKYFKWEESLINKLVEVKPDINFDDIKDEWLNLALLRDNDWAKDFGACIDKIPNDNIKKTFIQKIYNKVKSEIWSSAPYDDFDEKCATDWNTDVLWYFQKIINYLTPKQDLEWWKKIEDIIKDLFVTNEDLNASLPTWEQIPLWIALTDTTIPENTKNCFDTLLSFEIGEVADYFVNDAKKFAEKLEWLFMNTFPAINTIVWESSNYKYDESKLWEEYESKLNKINSNNDLSDEDKEEQIKKLKWKYYLIYLKKQNKSIGSALEQLYKNNFDYSKIDISTLEKYIDKMVDIRMDMILENWMDSALNLDIWGDKYRFSEFYKKLAKPSETTIELRPWINLPVEKKIMGGENLRLKDIDEFWNKAEAYDFLPISFKIKKSDVDVLPLDIEDRIKLLNFLQRFDTDGDNYMITWTDVWMLIYLFFVVNSRTPLSAFDSDKQKELEEFFWKAHSHEQNWVWEDNHEGSTNEQSNTEENTELESFTPEKFKEEIEKMWPWKFENWSEIWLPIWDSDLPGWWYQWMKIKISNIDMAKWTFKWKIYWGELDINLQWKSRDFKMTKKELNDLKNLAKRTTNSDKVWLLPNPDKLSFDSFKDSLNGKLWTTDLSFPIEWVTRNGSKFMRKIINDEWKEEDIEVKYFWASADDKSTYKVEYNPNRRCFTVSSSFNWESKLEDWKTKTERFSYKRDMDWNNFLIFFTQKGLYPQTEEQSKDALIRQDQEFKMVNGGHWKINWFSINNIKHGFKDIFGSLKKGLDAYNKKKDQEFRELAEEPLLKALGAMPFLPQSLKSAIRERKQEIYNERNNAAWQEIEWYLKTYQSDPDFATTFEKIPSFAKDLFWWKSYKLFLLNLKDGNNRDTKNVRKAAALLLANIEKWKSPYRGLSEWENKWYRVKVLLGEWHYRQFLRDKERCLNKIRTAGKDKAQLQDILASGEIDYIINNVRWNPDPEFFWSHEAPWNDDNPDNPSKRLLSLQFADKLESLNKWWFTASSVEEEFNNMKHNDFNLAKKTFEKNIKSTRYKAAWAALKKMFTLACNDDQVLMYKRCFLIYLLSGALDVNCRKDLWKQAYLRWKSLWFPPALLAKNKWHPEQVVALLDHFSEWNSSNKFSNNVKSYFHKSSELQWCPHIEDLITDFDKWWNRNDNADKFCNYLKGEFLITKNFETWDLWMDKVLKDLQWKANDQSNESGDNSLFCNATCINDAWILASPDTVRNRMMTTSEWWFGWETWDERDDRAKFFEKCAKEINAMPVEQEYTNLLMNKFLWWFWLTSTETKNEIYKRISTASHYKKKIEEHWWTYHPSENCKIKIKWESEEKIMEVPLWKITNEDIKKILWYWLEWRAWRQQKHCQQIPEALRKCFDAFQDYFQKAFDKWFLNSPSIKNDIFKVNIEREQHYRLWWWDVYRKIKKKENDPLTVVWEDSISGSDFGKLSDKEKKNLWRPILWRDNYLNDDMNEMEKQFKKNWCNVPTLTWTINEYEDLQHEYSNAA